MMPLVSLIEIRLPVPFQPVFTRYALAPDFFMLLNELLAVLGGVQRQEGCAEAGREGRRRLGDTALGTGQLGREAGEEVVLRLLGREDRDREAARRMRRPRGRSPSWRPEPSIRVSRYSRCGRSGTIRGYSRSPTCRRNRSCPSWPTVTFSSSALRRIAFQMSGSFSFREIDDLGVAAALEVEHAVVVPAVLVVADQLTLRDRSKGSSCRYPTDRRRSAVSPFSLVLAEQCIEAMPFSGSR